MPLEWTPARRRSFIISVLRSGTRRWPPKHNVLAAAFTEKKKNQKSGRLAKHFLCAKCKQEYTSTNVQVDHIKPIAGVDGFTTWDDFIERLFCSEDNLQVLCVECHAAKTAKEKAKRKKNETK